MKPESEFGGPAGPRRPQKMPWWPVALIAVLVIGALVWFFWSRRDVATETVAATPQPELPSPQAEPAPVDPSAEAWDLPVLAESDDFLRDVAARLSSHPEWLAWIATDDLVRRFVSAVDEMARGELPSAQLAFMTPKRGFSIAARNGRNYLGADGYRRYAPLVAVVEGIDARGAADLYRRLKPLVGEAYRDLGYPQADFDRTLAKALETILNAPSPDQPPQVVAAVRSYRFADPELEGLPAAQKLMIRMCPDNAGVVKRKLREIAAELDRSNVVSSGDGG